MRNRNRNLCSMFLLIEGLCFAQGVPAQKPAADEKPASVEGKVVNELTGEPLQRAHVTLQNYGVQGRFGAMTDIEGKFAIAALPPGSYVAKAERTGFVASVRSFTPPNNQIKLQAGEKRIALDLKLTPTGAVTGRVVDAAGEPMEYATVAAIANARQHESAVTDEKGVFRIGGLAPGKYRVQAKPTMQIPAPAEIRTDGSVEPHHRKTYYPSAADEKQAVRVEVTAGNDAAGIEIRMLRAPILFIGGKVMGLPPNAENVVVSLRDASNNQTGFAAMQKDGMFRIWRVDPGKYTCSAIRFEGGRQQQSAMVEVDATIGSVENIELRIFPPFEVTAQVEYDDEQAKPREAPEDKPGQKRVTPQPRRIMLRPEVQGSLFGNAAVAADGKLTFPQMAPLRYRATLQWQGAYVKSIRVGDVESDGSTIDLHNGPPNGLVTLRISSAMASITGTVSNTKGASAGSRVILARQPTEQGEQPRFISADSSGVYSIDNIAPGWYRLAALGSNDTAFLQPGYDEDYEESTLLIDVAAKDKLTLDLKERPATH